MSLQQYDRICYLYDYGDEWRFYAILKEVLDDEPSDTEPAVVNTEGESIDQYGSSRERRLSGYTTRNLGNAPNLLTTEQEYPFGEQSEAGSARRFGRNHVSRPRNPL